MTRPYTHLSRYLETFDNINRSTNPTLPNNFPGDGWDALCIGSYTSGNYFQYGYVPFADTITVGSSQEIIGYPPYYSGNKTGWRQAFVLPPGTDLPIKLKNKPLIGKMRMWTNLFATPGQGYGNDWRMAPFMGWTFGPYNGEEVRIASMLYQEWSPVNTHFRAVIVYFNGASWVRTVLNTQLLGVFNTGSQLGNWEVELEYQIKTQPNVFKLNLSHSVEYPPAGTVYSWSGEVTLPSALAAPSGLGEPVEMCIGYGNFEGVSTSRFNTGSPIWSSKGGMQCYWDDLDYSIEYNNWNPNLILRDKPKGRVVS